MDFPNDGIMKYMRPKAIMMLKHTGAMDKAVSDAVVPFILCIKDS